MPAFLTIGRILFVVLFIFSGAAKLLDIAGTTGKIEKTVTIPEMMAPYSEQMVGMTGMPMPQMMAIAAGVIEVVCGLMIALNFGARLFALVLVIFVAVATFYVHDFWNQPAGELRDGNMIHALKNLSLIGGLFIIAGIGGRRRGVIGGYNDV